MARKRDPDHGGHPLFWLLLGFLCGVMATLGALLLLSDDGAPEAALPEARIELPPLDGAPPPGGPLVLIPPPPSVEPATPIQEPVVRPTLPTFRPEPQAAPVKPALARPATTPRSAPVPGRSNADQLAEDAAASGMTARPR